VPGVTIGALETKFHSTGWTAHRLKYRGLHNPVTETEMVYVAIGTRIVPVLDQARAVLSSSSPSTAVQSSSSPSTVECVSIVWINRAVSDLDVTADIMEWELYDTNDNKLANDTHYCRLIGCQPMWGCQRFRTKIGLGSRMESGCGFSFVQVNKFFFWFCWFTSFGKERPLAKPFGTCVARQLQFTRISSAGTTTSQRFLSLGTSSGL
jgi:hypothetical protein